MSARTDALVSRAETGKMTRVHHPCCVRLSSGKCLRLTLSYQVCSSVHSFPGSNGRCGASFFLILRRIKPDRGSGRAWRWDKAPRRKCNGSWKRASLRSLWRFGYINFLADHAALLVRCKKSDIRGVAAASDANNAFDRCEPGGVDEPPTIL